MFSYSAFFFLVLCDLFIFFFFFKRKTASELRISYWSSDVCSSDLRVVVVVAGWQRPHAVGMVLGVLRIGVGFARRIEGEAGGLGHRDHLLLANVAGLVAVGHVGCGAMLDHAEHAAWLEHVEEAAEHAFGLAAGAPVVHVAEGQDRKSTRVNSRHV